MKKMVGLILGAGVVALVSFLALWVLDSTNPGIVSPLVSSFVKATPAPGVNKYASLTFMALSERTYKSEIKLGVATRNEAKYTTYVFTYKSDGKTVSGMANIPKGKGPFPVIVLLRGHVDREVYYIGHGTEKQANYYAEHGFLTLAPDFLGYGESDWEDQDILVARFTRPVTVLNLLVGIKSLPQADSSRIGLWGHSNGGQIALSVLEITKKNYPTSLWAPVSLGFPQSVLVYLGREEVGNPVKEKIDSFISEGNDPKSYSIAEYLDRITAPVIIHQGTADELIKTQWTKDLANNLKKRMLEANYYEYKGENHNFNRYKTTADVLRQRDVEFFQQKLDVSP
jgi:dipeptidyl aminopeptidase/acylaminoacyl peptidase